MSEPIFFDAACRAGRDMSGGGADFSELLDDMDRLGVGKALVRDFTLGNQNAALSNERLAEQLKQPGMERLTGVWCLLPSQCGELPEPCAFFDAMKKNRIAAVTLMPFQHRWIACGLTIGAYMEEARARKVPICLDGFNGAWRELYEFLIEYPDNIYLGINITAKWGVDRQLRPLMETYRGLYFSFDGHWVPRGVNELVRLYGAERILFGSGFPRFSAGAAMLQLKQSGLDEDVICRIASGNLEELLKGALA